MGQRVNPILFRAGISTFWDSANYPANKNLSSLVDTDFIFNIFAFFLKKNRIKLYSFKSNIVNNVFFIYVTFFKNRLILKSKLTKKKNQRLFKFKKPKLNSLKKFNFSRLNFNFFYD